MIADEDPRDSEGFPQDHAFSFAGAARCPTIPTACAARLTLPPPLLRPAHGRLRERDAFFTQRYGSGAGPDDDRDRIEVPANAAWRRIDNDWLYSAETLALKLNTGINNTSLVVAFELPKPKKVLFFAADAQRGNWVSWKDVTFNDGAKTVTAKDLLARTVLYKVGHHGSHNATLSGTADDEHPNLAWMGHGSAASEFTAMITAVNEWAMTQKPHPWVHPLLSIKEALLRKTRGKSSRRTRTSRLSRRGFRMGSGGSLRGGRCLRGCILIWR